MSVKHGKTGQDLKKIERGKRKAKPSNVVAKGETKDEIPPKPRQGSLPGTDEPHFAELAGYADDLELAKENAKSAAEVVKRKEAALIAAMLKRDRLAYTDRPRQIFIEITTTQRAKVKKYNHDDNDE